MTGRWQVRTPDEQAAMDRLWERAQRGKDDGLGAPRGCMIALIPSILLWAIILWIALGVR